MTDSVLSMPQIAALAKAPIWAVDTRHPLPDGAIFGIDGTPYVAVFSSPELLELYFSPEQPKVPLRCADMDRALPLGAGYVIDPGREPSVIVPPFDVARIAAASLPFPANHEVRVGHPAERPEELIADLAHDLQSAADLLSARWVWHQVKGQEPYAVIVVDCPDDAFAQVQELCWPALAKHRPIYDVSMVRHDPKIDLIVWAQEHIPPFYGR